MRIRGSRRRRGSVAVAALLLAIAGTLAAAGEETTKSLAPFRIHEKCMPLEAQQTLAYSFEADGKLVFNIHYHVGKDVHYPVTDHEMASAEDEFVAESEQRYCLMWMNRGKQDVELTMRYEVRAAAEGAAGSPEAKPADTDPPQ